MGNGASRSTLFTAVEQGDLETVKRKIPKMSQKDPQHLKRSVGDLIQVAQRHGHQHIVEFLLEQQGGDLRTSTHGRRERNQEKLEWVFDERLAVAWSDAIHRGCTKNRGLRKTVKKLLEAPFWNTDIPEEQEALTIVRECLDRALAENNSAWLLKAYTVDAPFFRRLNRDISKGSSRAVFRKLRGGWTGYYTGLIMNDPVFRAMRFPGGITYRGIDCSPKDLEPYEVGVALTAKSFQSSSKLRSVAQKFMQNPTQSAKDVIHVLFTFHLTDWTAGIEIPGEYTEFPDEEEVLILPGTLFYVNSVDKHENRVFITLQQRSWFDDDH